MSFAPVWGRDRETSRARLESGRQESNLWTPLRQSDQVFLPPRGNAPNELGPFRSTMVLCC